jgi:tRNA(adenine34) deaminase
MGKGGVLVEVDRYFLEIALEEARLAYEEGTIPIGAVLVSPDGKIVSRGRNRVYTTSDPSWHAEIDCIRQAGKELMDLTYKNQCTLYSTVEPCPMCTGAVILSDIKRVVWALSDDYLGAMRIMKNGNHFRHKYDKVETTAMPYEDLAFAAQELHRAWDKQRGKPYVVSNIEKTIT